MTEYFFQKDVEPLPIEITYSSLNPEEEKIITDIASWNNPNQHSKKIIDLAGRSIFLKSPIRTYTLDDYLYSKFDGLQLIGSGGSLHFVRNGLIETPKQIEVNPVNPTNNAKKLEQIGELRKLGKNGKFVYDSRKYIPLHGMDKPEALARKDKTQKLYQNIEEALATISGKKSVFVVPEIAFEGIYKSLKDEDGNNLRFQVYRIPLVKRFPAQASDILNNPTPEDSNYINYFLSRFCIKTGTTLRAINDMGYGYMDCHLGNFSFLDSNKRLESSIYATDLGSLFEVENKSELLKYRGFDLVMLSNSILTYNEILIKNGLIPSEGNKFKHLEITKTMLNLTLNGYFKDKFKKIVNFEKDLGWNLTSLMSKIAFGNVDSFNDEFEVYYNSLM